MTLFARLLLLLFAFPGPVVAGEDPQVVAEHPVVLEYLKAEEAARAVTPAFDGTPTTIRHGRLFVRCDEAQLERIRALLLRIDRPMTSPPTKFVEVRHLDVGELCAVLEALIVRVEFDPESCFAIPQPRTNRVFLMGAPEFIAKAEELIRALDVE